MNCFLGGNLETPGSHLLSSHLIFLGSAENGFPSFGSLGSSESPLCLSHRCTVVLGSWRGTVVVMKSKKHMKLVLLVY